MEEWQPKPNDKHYILETSDGHSSDWDHVPAILCAGSAGDLRKRQPDTYLRQSWMLHTPPWLTGTWSGDCGPGSRRPGAGHGVRLAMSPAYSVLA